MEFIATFAWEKAVLSLQELVVEATERQRVPD
jgi:hypothetical protein